MVVVVMVVEVMVVVVVVVFLSFIISFFPYFFFFLFFFSSSSFAKDAVAGKGVEMGVRTGGRGGAPTPLPVHPKISVIKKKKKK